MGIVRMVAVWMDGVRPVHASQVPIVEEIARMETATQVPTRIIDTRREHRQAGHRAVPVQVLLIRTEEPMNSMIVAVGHSEPHDLCWHRWTMRSAHDTVRMI
jgi:hypothetical protein